MMNKKNLITVTFILLAICVGTVEVILNSQGEVTSDVTQTAWGAISLFLTIVWAMADSETNDFDKPFDFGFLMYMFWPIALPYYLYSTRGLDGIVLYIGFMGVWVGPWLAGLVAYTYVYTS